MDEAVGRRYSAARCSQPLAVHGIAHLAHADVSSSAVIAG